MEEKTSISIRRLLVIIVSIVAILLSIYALRIWIKSVVHTQQEQISHTIINTIMEQAKLDLFRPDIVSFNMDSIQMKQLTDSISRHVASIITETYANKKKDTLIEVDFQSFLIYPNKVDHNGNYTLTEPQLNELKNHIQFLTSQVDKAVTATKDEITKEIDRINTLVSIWIGVIGLFGVFIPLIINYKASEDIKEAKYKADEAHNLIDNHKDDIKKVKEIGNKVVVLRDDVVKITGEVETTKISSDQSLALATEAKTTATEANQRAKKVEKLILAQNGLFKIKDIDASFLLYRHNPIELLKIYLQEIHSNLNNCVELFDEPVVKDVFRQLALTLHLLAPYDFINPANFDLLNQFALNTSNLIAQQITQEKFKEILELLSDLVESIEPGRVN